MLETEKEVGDPPVAPCDKCNKENAHLRCSSCKIVYYCTAECQKKHWKTHKLQCKESMKKGQEAEEEAKRLEYFSKKYDEKLEDGCSICYEPVKSSEKLQLPCHHIFCASCMGNYSRNTIELKCPLCRQALNNFNIYQEVYSNVASFVNRAFRVNPRHSKELRIHYATIALEEYQRLESLVNSIPENKIDPSSRWIFRDVHMQALIFLDRFEEAFAIGQSILSDPHFPQHDTYKYAQVIFHLVDCHNARGEFNASWDLLKQVLKQITQPNDFVKETREIFHRLIRIFYELQQYDHALVMARQAVYMNPYYDNVYEYIVKVYVAKHDWVRALNTMKKAIRYEAPWDVKNTAYLIEAYKQLELEHEEYVKKTASS